MKLINETEYRSDDLRRLIIAGFHAEGVNHTGYYVYVEKIRGNQIHGYGYYNRKCLCLKLPKIYRENYGILNIDFITRINLVG